MTETSLLILRIDPPQVLLEFATQSDLDVRDRFHSSSRNHYKALEPLDDVVAYKKIKVQIM